MRVALVNYFHSGDVIMSRALIRRVRPLLIDRVALELRCQANYRYLWADQGLPTYSEQPEAGVHTINMWFGHGGDLLGVSGLTHATQVTSYNRQASLLDLPLLDPSEPVPPIDFAEQAGVYKPGVLVENGPVLSGQRTAELNQHLYQLGKDFSNTTFYCTGKVPSRVPPFPTNIIDISEKNLIEISHLSNTCTAMLSRLSGPFIASLTSHNQGRMKRLVLGEPIGCPIWDERDVEYFWNIEAITNRLRSLHA